MPLIPDSNISYRLHYTPAYFKKSISFLLNTSIFHSQFHKSIILQPNHATVAQVIHSYALEKLAIRKGNRLPIPLLYQAVITCRM